MKKSLNQRLFIVYLLLFIFAVFSIFNMIVMTVTAIVFNNNVFEFGSILNFVPFPCMALLFGSLTYMSALERSGREISDEKRKLFIIINITLAITIVGSILYLELIFYPTWN